MDEINQHILLLIKEGQNESVKQILQNCYLYDADSTQITPLHHAVRYGNKEITKFLLDKGFNINSGDSMGNTPLMIGVTEDQQSIIKMLLGYEADVFALNNEKKSVLHMLHECTGLKLSFYICQQFLHKFRKECPTYKDLVRKLLDSGFHDCLTAYSLDFKMIEYLVRCGYRHHYVHPLRKFTGMHIAVYFDDLDSVKVLLKYGSDVKSKDDKNASPLYYLYKDNKKHNLKKIEILKILLNQGLSPTFCNLHGYFDIVYTLYRGNREAVRVLIQSKLDFLAKDKIHGRTPLHYLAQNTNPGIVEELELHADLKYDVHAVDNLNLSVLYLGVNEGNSSMVEFLLDKGVQPHTHANPLLYYAFTRSKPEFQNRYDQCVELLLLYNDDPQFAIVRPNGEIISVFDVSNDFNRIKPVIAELSVREKCGQYITEMTRNKINSDPTLYEYFNTCRKLIEEDIFNSVTLLKLFVSDHETISRYLKDDDLLQEIEIFCEKHDIKSSHSYLYDKWLKCYRDGKEYLKLKYKTSRAVRKILGEDFIGIHLVITKVINYLDIPSLRQLAQF